MLKYVAKIYLLSALFAALFIASSANAQYWFQSGARSSPLESYNNGSSIEIETVSGISSPRGSMGFWVGEDLSNGAFIQAGYEIVNKSGLYPAFCNESKCTSYINLTAGKPTWFWEYFPANKSTAGFYGEVGPDGSAGADGTFNTYSFRSFGNVWNIYFNGNIIGSVNLGTSTSGLFYPSAFGEYANATSNNVTMNVVQFKNFSVYKKGQWIPVASAYAYIGYGYGSLMSLPNLYGVQEVGNYANYFEVGSGLPLSTNNTLLWNTSYKLSINSKYGAAQGAGYYKPYSYAILSAPRYAYIGNNTRAVFVKWVGSGLGSYTGSENSTSIQIKGNITETIQWALQYYLNVSSPYGAVSGSGWYNSSSIANFSVLRNIAIIGYGKRAVFAGWSNGAMQPNSTISMVSPYSIKALWKVEYEVNATSQYGKVAGNGWFENGSRDFIFLYNTTVPINSTARLAFAEWSNGISESSFYYNVTSPLFISALYGKEYEVKIHAFDKSGRSVYPNAYQTSMGNVSSSFFAFSGSNLHVSGAFYDSMLLPLNFSANILQPQTLNISLPLYDISIYTYNIFGMPVNASLVLTFKNGTTSTYATGSSGSIVIPDVPLGYAKGYAYQGNEKIAVYVSGNSATVRFADSTAMSIIAVLIAGICIAAAIKFIRRRKI
ncbi:MAG: hypothetical protein QXS81_02480 [Candidatus Micrarchaeaceae archaeon]